MRFLRVVGTFLALLLLPACAATPFECNEDTCSNGCCQDGECYEGGSDDFCGVRGASCNECSRNSTCVSGACVDKCGPSNCPNGCCNDNGECVASSEQDYWKCGLQGQACANCWSDYGVATCMGGTCCADLGMPCESASCCPGYTCRDSAVGRTCGN